MSDPSKSTPQYIAGRGAQINPANPFDSTFQEESGQIWNDEEELEGLKKMHNLETHPKSIINRVDSPDIPFAYSMNPYQGCEHGCVYCYARNTHTYWGYSAGIEFEQKILVKQNAPELLEKQLWSKNWEPHPIMLSGNTGCYQPAERKYKLTRQLLEIAWRYKHPIALITKNSLILRDLDILKQMASKDLIHVAITITTLEEDLRQKLEPRTATGLKRIEVIRQLSDAAIPVNVMMGPIIPSMTDHEIFRIAKAASEAGAKELHYTILRLNGDVAIIFKDWL